jgi:hypothetical protein
VDVTDDQKSTEAAVLAAAENVARLRVEYAIEWQLARRKVNSDMHATQIAIELTEDALTVAQANLRVMEARLK